MDTSAWIGVPWPCGIYITKTKFQLRPPEKTQITYFDSPDLPLTGVRNAHSVLVLWSYISTYSYDEQVKMGVEAEETACYAEKKLKELEAEIQQDLWVANACTSLACSLLQTTQ